MLTAGSLNCMIDTNGKVCQSLGYTEELDIDLGVPGSPATPYHLSKYDITVFAVGTKIKYFDWNTRIVYDTGITMTAGTLTRGDGFMGDFYGTNTTDGLRRIVFGRVNDAAATAGDKNIVIDADMAARIHVFGFTTGNLRIQGINESFTNTGTVTGAADNGVGLIRLTVPTHGLQSGDVVTVANVTGTTEANATWTITRIDATHFDLRASTFSNAYVSGGTWALNPASTGNMNLTSTLSQSYSDNAVCMFYQDISSGLEKASKVFFFKNRMGLIGSEIAMNSDQPNATEYFGKFATPLNLQDIINFTVGSGGATTELVGNSGRVTNVLPAKDYLYSFTEDQTFSCAAGNIETTGDAIGETTPELQDELHGCLNEDSACVIGNNEISYITNDNHIMRGKIATDSGAPLAVPDESFDIPIREDLKNMDPDQTGACAFCHRSKKRAIHQIKILGQWYWYIYDNSLLFLNGDGTYARGAWQPPQQVLFARGFFERKGILYATDGSDDTVYSINTAFDYNLTPIQSTIAFGNFGVGNSNMKKAIVQGEVTQAAIVKMKAYVTNRIAGRVSGSEKVVDGSTFTYSEEHAIGADRVGGGGVEQITQNLADWTEEFDIYPSEANRVQLIITNENGGYFSISSYQLVGNATDHTFTNSL